MTEQDQVLGLLDDLLALVEGTPATSVEVDADGFSVRLRRNPRAARTRVERPRTNDAATPHGELIRVRSPAVGIFTAAREWQRGDRVEQGGVLGGVQSLGLVAEITAPSTGAVREVLVASGAPVEYGQALFSLESA